MNNLIDNSKHQVFILGCRAHVPFVFAKHSWVVVNKMGALSRWEILYKENKDKNLGHLHIDAMPLFQGISIFPFLQKYFWRAKLIGVTEGDTAEEIIAFIEKSKENYPYLKSYSLTGPNSNTYTQWILNAFPECAIKLPKSFIGKDYAKIHS